jgi:hypothetical protein
LSALTDWLIDDQLNDGGAIATDGSSLETILFIENSLKDIT